jgi:hypothetical protein
MDVQFLYHLKGRARAPHAPSCLVFFVGGFGGPALPASAEFLNLTV